MADKNNLKNGLNALGLSEADFNALPKRVQQALSKTFNDLEKFEQISNRTKSVWDDLATTIAGIKMDDFMSQIEMSSQDIAQMGQDMKKLNDAIGDNATSLNKDWIRSLNNGQTQIINLINSTTDLSKDMAAALTKAVQSGNIGEFLQTQGELGQDALEKLIASSGFKSLDKFIQKDGVRGFMEMNKELKRMGDLVDLNGQKVFNLGAGLDKIAQNMTKAFSLEKIRPALFDFDKIIHETQKNTGIMVADTVDHERAFTALNTKAAQFGLSVQDSADMMAELSKGLRTTNFDVLSNAAMNLAVMSSATGLSVGDMTELNNQMMLFGRSSTQINKLFIGTMQSAKLYGLNGKKILQDITKSLPKARELGWVGGEEALKKMALQAEHLGLSLDGIIESSKKMRTLEGSLEASADLALTGLNINPLQMLGAARRGGKEYLDIIGQLSQGIGHLNERTGAIDFNALDKDMLQSRMDAIGYTGSLEDLQKQIAQSAQDNQKVNLAPNLFSGLEDDEKAFLLNAMKMDGKKLDGTFKVDGITDLTKLTKTNIDNAIKKVKDDNASAEKMAEGNMHFQQSVEALKGSIMSTFTYLQPIIDKATTIVQGISQWFGNLPTTLKIAFAAGAATLALIYSAGKQILAGYFFGLGFNKAAMGGGFLNSLKSMFRNPFRPPATATPPISTTGLPNTNQAPQISRLSQALSAMPSPAQLLALSVALVAFGLAIVGIGYGIKVASEGLADLVQSFKGLQNSTAALGAVISVMGGMVGIVYALSGAVAALGEAGTAGAVGLLAIGAATLMIGGSIWLASEGLSRLVSSFKGLGNSGAAVAALTITMGGFVAITAILAAQLPFLAGGVAALGAAGTAGAVGLLAIGASATLIGAGIMLAAKGISIVVDSINSLVITLNKVSANSVGILLTSIAIGGLSAALITLGASGLFVGPGLALLAGGLTLLGLSLKISLPLLEQISSLKFESLNKFTDSLKSMAGVLPIVSGSIITLVPSLMAIGVAGLVSLPGLLAASLGLTTLGKSLSLVMPGFEALSNIKTGSFQNIGSSLMSMVPGMLAFASASILSPLMLLGAAGLSVLAPALSAASKSFQSLQSIDWNSFGGIKNGLFELTKGLLSFSSVGIVAPLIGLAAGSFYLLSTGLSQLKGIDAKSISEVGTALGNSVTGLLKFSAIGIVSPLLTLAGLAFGSLVNGVSNLQNFDSSKLSNLGQFLSSSTGDIIKFSAVGAFYPLINKAGDAVKKLAESTLSIDSFKGNVLLDMSSALANSSTNLIKFSSVGLFATLLTKAGEGINQLMTSIGSIGKYNNNSINKISSELSSSVGGFIKFSSLGIFSGLLINAGEAVSKIANAIIPINNFKGNAIAQMSTALSDSVSGFLKFSTIGLVSPLLMMAGNVLTNLITGLASASSINLTGLSNISNTLSDSTSGLFKFSTLGLISPLLMVAGSALTNLMNNLSSTSSVNLSGLGNISKTLSDSIPGLFKFSTLGIISPLLMMAGSALANLMNNLSSTSSVNLSGLSSLSKTLSDSIPGLFKFSTLGLISPLLMMAGSALGTLTKSLLNIGNINISSLSSMSDILGNSIGGFAKFSAVGFLGPLLSLAGNSLSTLFSALSNLKDINIGILPTISSTLENSVSGLLKFSALGLAYPLLSLATSALSFIISGLSKLPSVNLSNLNTLGQALVGIVPSLSTFATIGLLSPLLSGAFNSLSSVSKGLDSLKDIKLNSVSGINDVVDSLSDSLLKYSKIALLSPLIMLASAGMLAIGTSLSVISPAFNNLSSINWDSLNQMASGLTGIVPGLLLFSTLGALSVPMILGATGLMTSGKLLSMAMPGFEMFNNLKLDGIKKLTQEFPGLISGLASMSVIGLLSIPIAAGASLLAAAGNLLFSASSGFTTFAKVDWQTLSSMGDSMNKFLQSLLSFSTISLLSVPVLAGATMLAGAGVLFKAASGGFEAMTNINWGSLQNMSSALLSIIPGLTGFSALGLLSVPISAAGLAIGLLGKMLFSSVPGFNAITKVDWNAFGNIGGNLTNALASLGKMATFPLLAGPILIGSTLLGAAGSMLGVASNGFNTFSNVNWKGLTNIGDILQSMVGGLLSFSATGIVSPLIASAGISLTALGKGLESITNIKEGGLSALGGVLSDITPAIGKFSLIGLLSPALLLASGALASLGGALGSMSSGVEKVANVNWSDFSKAGSSLDKAIPSLLNFSKVGLLSAPIGLGAMALSSVGNNLMEAAAGFTSIAGVDWNKVNSMGDSLENLWPKITNLGGGILAVPVITFMSNALSSLSETMLELSPALDMASKSMNAMSMSLDNVKSSIKGVDASSLNTLADYSNKIVNAQASNISTNSSNNNTQAAYNFPKSLNIEPFTVHVKLNGKDIHEEIVKATAHLS